MLDSGGDSLLVCHLRTTLVHLYVKLTAQTVKNNVQMQLTHTADDSLTRHLVALHAESGVFLNQLGQRIGHLVHIALRQRFHSNADNRLWELHRLKDDGVFLVTQRMAGLNLFETDSGSDVTGLNAVQRVLLVGMHLHNTRNALLLARIGVVHIRTRL